MNLESSPRPVDPLLLLFWFNRPRIAFFLCKSLNRRVWSISVNISSQPVHYTMSLTLMIARWIRRLFFSKDASFLDYLWRCSLRPNQRSNHPIQGLITGCNMRVTTYLFILENPEQPPCRFANDCSLCNRRDSEQGVVWTWLLKFLDRYYLRICLIKYSVLIGWSANDEPQTSVRCDWPMQSRTHLWSRRWES